MSNNIWKNVFFSFHILYEIKNKIHIYFVKIKNYKDCFPLFVTYRIYYNIYASILYDPFVLVILHGWLHIIVMIIQCDPTSDWLGMVFPAGKVTANEKEICTGGGGVGPYTNVYAVGVRSKLWKINISFRWQYIYSVLY